jgi:hypothetical protein
MNWRRIFKSTQVNDKNLKRNIRLKVAKSKNSASSVNMGTPAQSDSADKVKGQAGSDQRSRMSTRRIKVKPDHG